MSRIKPTATAPVLQNLGDVDSALAQIAALRRNVNLIETAMNDEVDGIKLRAAQEAEPFKVEIAMLEQALTRYAEYNKAELFAKRKSVDLTFGVFGFRASTKIKLLAKMTWARVLQNIHDWDRPELIRIKEEPDKDVMKRLSPEELKELGCKVVQEDVFYYELAEQELGQETGDAA
jgi:phage host-nuclease inhibitor protein Gam